MINIKYTNTTDKITLSVEGHANQAEYGKDIVCASASILTYTVAQIVQDIHSKGGFKKSPTIKIMDGYAHISCHPRDEYKDETIQAFNVVKVGFQLLAHNYSQYVSLTEA